MKGYVQLSHTGHCFSSSVDNFQQRPFAEELNPSNKREAKRKTKKFDMMLRKKE